MIDRAVAVLALLATAGMAAASPAGDPLARYRATSRVLVILATRPNDPSLAQQRRIFRALGDGAAERDLVLVEAFDGSPRTRELRRTYGSDPDSK